MGSSASRSLPLSLSISLSPPTPSPPPARMHAFMHACMHAHRHSHASLLPGRMWLRGWVQVLCIQGFLAARKHADRIILLVEMMQHSGCPCFKAGGPKAVAALRKRFHMGHTEAQVRSLHAMIHALGDDPSLKTRTRT